MSLQETVIINYPVSVTTGKSKVCLSLDSKIRRIWSAKRAHIPELHFPQATYPASPTSVSLSSEYFVSNTLLALYHE